LSKDRQMAPRSSCTFYL